MARSVRELKQESERSRAELAASVDQLRARLTDTAGDIRNIASPQHIKSEVSDFIGQKTQGWVDTLKQQAIENPIQTMAACTVAAVPVLRMARGLPVAAVDDRGRPCADLEDGARARHRGCCSGHGQRAQHDQ